MKLKIALCLIAALNAVSVLAFSNEATAAVISGGSFAKDFGSELDSMTSVDNELDAGGGESGQF